LGKATHGEDHADHGSRAPVQPAYHLIHNGRLNPLVQPLRLAYIEARSPLRHQVDLLSRASGILLTFTALEPQSFGQDVLQSRAPRLRIKILDFTETNTESFFIVVPGEEFEPGRVDAPVSPWTERSSE